MQRSLRGMPRAPRPAFIMLKERPPSRFSVNNLFAGGAYLKVDSTVGSLIDWVSVQCVQHVVPEAHARVRRSTTFRYGHSFRALSASSQLRGLLTRTPRVHARPRCVQFYNRECLFSRACDLRPGRSFANPRAEGTDEYTTCDGLLNESGGSWPQSSLFEIAASGVDLDKLVIGKPALSSGDASSGYIDPSTLAGCLAQAKAKGWGACRFAGSLLHAN